ncbi:hypothetical protein [Defluviitalea phaphyphila]|uniref:hypothetical protein n=1 Tax=Defluviitalea phaphyphila TaxID=1473580 RepID=UPI000730C778|nr:hypothetical protein [Defluviitalea phaphyphila]
MIGIAKFICIICVFHVSYNVSKYVFKPLDNKRISYTRSFIKLNKKEKFKNTLVRIKKIIALKYGKYFLISDIKRMELLNILKRIDRTKTPEEVRLEQILYSGLAILISFCILKISTILGYASMIFIVLGWLYPIDEIQRIVERKNNNILKDIPVFYNMIFYQYSKSVHIFLADIIKDFLPNANKDMAEELETILDDIEYGEEYALKQFKSRVPLKYVIRICDVIETRLKGYDNLAQMAYLKNELDELRVTRLEIELEKRKRKSESLQIILIIILGIYIIIYYYFQMFSALELFSM